MDTATQTLILKRMQRTRSFGVFTPKDFMDVASRDAIDQSLSRLVRRGDIARIGRGLYCVPRINARLGIAVPPDPDDVARAIGRSTNSRVTPSRARVANRLGLSTQVPAKSVYLTDGPTRTIRVGNRSFHMKHVVGKHLPAGDDLSDLALQAIQSIGPDGLDDTVIDTLRSRLSPRQRHRLARAARYGDAWVADAARRIASVAKDPVHG